MEPRLQDWAEEPSTGEGEGQEVEHGNGPPGAAQGNVQSQAAMVQEEETDEEKCWWAVQYFPEEEVGRAAGPYFRLPMQHAAESSRGVGCRGQQGSAAGQVDFAEGTSQNRTENKKPKK